MTRVAAIAAALLLFAMAATANSGGYRFGISDQAFYVPAVALENHPDLFPRDRALLGPQMRLWAGGRVLAAAVRLAHDDQPAVFFALYALTLTTLFLSGIALARSFGYEPWTTTAFLALLTLRHRIAKTGANSLEGYGHPRMLAFGIGLGALAAIVSGRRWLATALVAIALVVHPTTGAWFAAVVVVAMAWAHPRRARMLGALAVAAVGTAMAMDVWRSAFERMDPVWLGVLDEKDYLFPAAWPAYAWITNLLYPVVILVLFRQRARRGLARPGESALVAGLMALVAFFLLSVPLTQAHIALAVQLQVNRVFWLLDAVAALYLAWWFVDGARPSAAAWRRTIVATVAIAASARGFYVLKVEAHRPLVQVRPARDSWMDAMQWLSTQPASWQVLADPGHAWKYGESVRVAAFRDTMLEAGKDSAMAMYDRSVALRVAERAAALSAFDDLSADALRAIASKYDVTVVIEPASRTLALPVRYRNGDFVIYGLP